MSDSDQLFLSEPRLCKLTGRKQKSRQIEWLRQNGIPFRISATGHPVVTVSAVESREPVAPAPKPARTWSPRVIGA